MVQQNLKLQIFQIDINQNLLKVSVTCTEESELERPKKLSAEEKVKAAQVLDKHLGPLSYLFTKLGPSIRHCLKTFFFDFWCR